MRAYGGAIEGREPAWIASHPRQANSGLSVAKRVANEQPSALTTSPAAEARQRRQDRATLEEVADSYNISKAMISRLRIARVGRKSVAFVYTKM